MWRERADGDTWGGLVSDLERVTRRLKSAVLAFLRTLRAGQHFTAADLAGYVMAHHPGTAPGSPCRVLRHLREVGAARVDLVDQSASTYVVTEPPPEAAWRRCQRDGHAYERDSDYECARCGEDRGGHQSSLFSGERFE